MIFNIPNPLLIILHCTDRHPSSQFLTTLIRHNRRPLTLSPLSTNITYSTATRDNLPACSSLPTVDCSDTITAGVIELSCKIMGDENSPLLFELSPRHAPEAEGESEEEERESCKGKNCEGANDDE